MWLLELTKTTPWSFDLAKMNPSLTLLKKTSTVAVSAANSSVVIIQAKGANREATTPETCPLLANSVHMLAHPRGREPNTSIATKTAKANRMLY